MLYLTTHSTHFIYGHMASDIWLRTILIVRKETRCRHIGYSYRLTARVLLYAPSHRQDNTYHGLCYTSCGALAGTRNSSMGLPHEGSIRRPIAPWANDLPLSYVPLRTINTDIAYIMVCYDKKIKHPLYSYSSPVAKGRMCRISVYCCVTIQYMDRFPLRQGFLTLLEVLNPANFISAFTEPFVIGQIKYDFFKT